MECPPSAPLAESADEAAGLLDECPPAKKRGLLLIAVDKLLLNVLMIKMQKQSQPFGQSISVLSATVSVLSISSILHIPART